MPFEFRLPFTRQLSRPDGRSLAEATPAKVIDLQQTIKDVSRELELPEALVTQRIDVMEGSRLIFEKGLSASEVELSSFLKVYRKKLFVQHLDDINARGQQSDKDGIEAYQSLRSDYKKLHDLHASYRSADDAQSRQQHLEEISGFLGKDVPVLDAGIENDRFFDLLPEVLSAFSPAELEQMYAINTAFRKHIAVNIADNLGVPVQLRGSLVRGDSRSFGNGYNANFPWLDSPDPMTQPTGSDFDFKFTSGADFQRLEGRYQQMIYEVNQQGKSLGVSIGSDLGVMEATIGGDGVPATVTAGLDMTIPEYLRPALPVPQYEPLGKTPYSLFLQSIYSQHKDDMTIAQMKELARTVAVENHLVDTGNHICITDDFIQKLSDKVGNNFLQFVRNSADAEAQTTEVKQKFSGSILSFRRSTDFLGFADSSALHEELKLFLFVYISQRYNVNIEKLNAILGDLLPANLSID